MKLFRKIKHIAGRGVFKREKEPERTRKGSNFTEAQKVAFVYKDIDEDYFKLIKAYVKQLKAEFNIKNILALGFVDADTKHVPVWQNQKLEFEYFTREDLNWHLKPVSKVNKFILEEFDILIDLTDGKNLPLNFLMRESRAMMKVGMKGSTSEKFYDLIIDMGQSMQTDKYLDQIKLYLSNPKIR